MRGMALALAKKKALADKAEWARCSPRRTATFFALRSRRLEPEITWVPPAVHPVVPSHENIARLVARIPAHPTWGDPRPGAGTEAAAAEPEAQPRIRTQWNHAAGAGRTPSSGPLGQFSGRRCHNCASAA